MKLKEAIDKLLKINNKTKGDLASDMGYRSSSAVSNILARGNVTLDKLIEMCAILKYDVVLIPANQRGPKSDSRIILEREEATEK